MECFLHIHNLHHTERRGLAGPRTRLRLHTPGQVRAHERIDKNEAGNNKGKGGKFLAAALSCTINTADQSFIKGKMAFVHLVRRALLSPSVRMMSCQIRFPAVYVTQVSWENEAAYYCTC